MRELMTAAWDVLLRFSGAAGGIAGGGSLPLLAVLMGLNLILSLFANKEGAKQRVIRMLRGALARSAVLGLILLAGWLDGIGGWGNTLKNAVIGFYICDEGLSLLKHAAMLGIPIPNALRRAAGTLKIAEHENENIWLSGTKETAEVSE